MFFGRGVRGSSRRLRSLGSFACTGLGFMCDGMASVIYSERAPGAHILHTYTHRLARAP
jgi:hypothetical protein